MRCIRSWFGALSLLTACLTAPATNADTAPTGKPIVFDCDDGTSFAATYYFAPPRNTPLRVTATLDGKTRELTRDRDDAQGWAFADAEIGVTSSGASVHRGAKTTQCKVHNGMPGSGVPAWFTPS